MVLLAGYPIDSMKVRLYHGSYHDVDSDSLSFELAARIGFKEAARKMCSSIIGTDHGRGSNFAR